MMQDHMYVVCGLHLALTKSYPSLPILGRSVDVRGSGSLCSCTISHVLELRAQGWRPNFTALLTTQPGDPSVFQSLDVTDIIQRQKEAYLSAFLSNEALSTLVLYTSLQPEYRYAHYLLVVQSFPNRRLISGF